ncbi:DMT family transporter [Fictibacillus phosphorivorans]|uniref:DMT family transporter n=1 Tax=Fictibacillus phosphorivorans TaxID=1221500 RepID=UPI00203CECE0|nr:EamA family transporter [Fictibacillus phosphorivorans]MCM3718722.1 DMT family transporter [Fictibacillus phosphorivorans]MCM3776345.1 DMT family transporter [Fictibacillus phosphorivorans]
MSYQTKIAFLFVAIGASLWGIIGYFVKELAEIGYTPLQIVFLRAISAFIFFFLWIIFYRPGLLKLQLKDIWYFFGTGVLSVSFFNWCYFTTIQHSSLAIAAILLYTAPVFVLLISLFVFKERLTWQKITALFITFLGCMFVSGIFSGNFSELSWTGLLTGLGAGFGYSLYSIFGKLASKTYKTLTISFYTFLFAMIALFPISGITSSETVAFHSHALLYTAGLGLFPTVLAYWFYTQGLNQVEASKASIVSTVEPVVATIMGLFLYQESVTLIQVTGILLVLSAVLLIQERKTKPVMNTSL